MAEQRKEREDGGWRGYLTLRAKQESPAPASARPHRLLRVHAREETRKGRWLSAESSLVAAASDDTVHA